MLFVTIFIVLTLIVIFNDCFQNKMFTKYEIYIYETILRKFFLTV